MASCYVYYRVSQPQPPELRNAIRALMEDVQQRTGIAGRLAQRRDDAGMWMEIYDGIADLAAFERELAAATARHPVARRLADSRKTEIFVPMIENKG
jgi:hypothetical protein